MTDKFKIGDFAYIEFDEEDSDNGDCVDGLYRIDSIDADANDNNYPVNLHKPLTPKYDRWDECCNIREVKMVVDLSNPLLQLVFD